MNTPRARDDVFGLSGEEDRVHQSASDVLQPSLMAHKVCDASSSIFWRFAHLCLKEFTHPQAIIPMHILKNSRHESSGSDPQKPDVSWQRNEQPNGRMSEADIPPVSIL